MIRMDRRQLCTPQPGTYRQAQQPHMLTATRMLLTRNVSIRTLSYMQTPDAPLLTTDQVADLLQVSRRSVERLEESGQLAPVRIGRLVRYRRADVESLISGEKSA